MTREPKKTQVIKGIGVTPQIIMGKAYLVDRGKIEAPARVLPENQVPWEIERFRDAVEESKKQLRSAKEKLLHEDAVGPTYILDAHLLLLEDKNVIQSTRETIEQSWINSEWALKINLDRLRKIFDSIDDDYLKSRKTDLDYIEQRILRNLTGRGTEALSQIKEEVIVVAHDLSPADTAQMAKDKITAFVTDVGGTTSHTAIMARSLEIPAVVGSETATHSVNTGDTLIVDGITGVVVVNPSPEIIQEYMDRNRTRQRIERELFLFRDLPAETLDGFRVNVLANIELVEEIPAVLDHGAEGIGLYRTEYLYLNRKELPTEEDHFQAYKTVVKAIAPHPAVIRTLDIGGDKFISHLELAEEMNPAMGLRAIRFSLKEPEIFKVQLRAMLRASVYGKVKILLPMISGVREIREVKKTLNEVRLSLTAERIPYDPKVEIGIMMEVPSAATISDILAKEVDFFSIGTNDLIQYTLAIDRVNEYVTHLYEPLHPAILRLVRQVVKAAHDAGIRVAMCGEMAGDPLYVPVLLGLELDDLSMNVLSIFRVKKILRAYTLRECKELVEASLGLSTPEEIEALVRASLHRKFPEEFRELFNSKLSGNS
ncbi:MAG TPA: phosphoenolpyruvate--protein phosphotransferase [Thermodesulfobacteriota bacterium]|nr:phosphoenolpyruvate--protein phosphotransferase [Thermodesulfobacteriota bacterium]